MSNPNTGWRVKQTGNVVYPPLAEPPFFSIAEARAWVRNEGHGTIVRA